ncbi:hypothetical protein ACWEN3_40955 [Streptomyces sp. NPDC004561]
MARTASVLPVSVALPPAAPTASPEASPKTLQLAAEHRLALSDTVERHPPARHAMADTRFEPALLDAGFCPRTR